MRHEQESVLDTGGAVETARPRMRVWKNRRGPVKVVVAPRSYAAASRLVGDGLTRQLYNKPYEVQTYQYGERVESEDWRDLPPRSGLERIPDPGRNSSDRVYVEATVEYPERIGSLTRISGPWIPKGRRERRLDIRCDCGHEYAMGASAWYNRASKCCHACAVKAFNKGRYLVSAGMKAGVNSES